MSNLTCDIYPSHNRTFDFTNGEYGEIPFTLTINVCAWVVLIILFSIMRKIAWNYGRIALVSRHEEKVVMTTGENPYNVWTSLFYGEHDSNSLGSQDSLDTTIRSQDKGLFSWILCIFRLKDQDILLKCGNDAIQYLSFQRYLLVYMTIVCILSVAIIIPVNFTGHNIGNATDFGHTTIGNLEPVSPKLWVHTILALVFLVIVVGLMVRFSKNLQYESHEHVSRTLMISNIPPKQCSKNLIVQHFSEAYPEVVVHDVQFAYNIEKLSELEHKRQVAADALMNSQLEYQKTQKRPLVKPHAYSRWLCKCCGVLEEMDAMDYYTEQETKWRLECEEEKVKVYQSPLGVAFVTFQNEAMAARVCVDFSNHCKSGGHSADTTSVSKELEVDAWEVKSAPSPENIYWQNITKNVSKWWIKTVAINVFVVVILFFFTSPPIVLNSLKHIQKNGTDVISGVTPFFGPFVQQFLPTLLLWIFSALLPSVVYWSDQLTGHWTKTAEHHAVMLKTFIFLLLMVLILPSLGLTSANALFQWIVTNDTSEFRWQCIFLPGNGAFFVNYIITSAFIGTCLELLRFSELFIYAIRLLRTRSSAERTAVRRTTVWDFQYGTQYGWMLCIFTVIIAYSIPCPLIAPFGLVYMAFKHIIDRYNIYFAYKPSRINRHIHSLAVNFVVIAVILLQCNIVFFTAVRSEGVNPVYAFSLVAVFFSLLIFVGRVCFGWCKYLDFSPYKGKHAKEEESSQQFGEQSSSLPDLTEKSPSFVAKVLQDDQTQPPDVSSAQQGPRKTSYGATEAVHSDN